MYESSHLAINKIQGASGQQGRILTGRRSLVWQHECAGSLATALQKQPLRLLANADPGTHRGLPAAVCCVALVRVQLAQLLQMYQSADRMRPVSCVAWESHQWAPSKLARLTHAHKPGTIVCQDQKLQQKLPPYAAMQRRPTDLHGRCSCCVVTCFCTKRLQFLRHQRSRPVLAPQRPARRVPVHLLESS
jgi:hypothetical protein